MGGVELLRRPLDDLMAEARAVRDEARGRLVTYSPKVFIPLTKLCRDVCHYCTFARPPRRGERAYMTIDEVVEIARAGERVGCREALFTLGDKPELRYRVARAELASLGCATTLEYLARAARAVLDETSLLPHLNPGALTRADFELLRPVAAAGPHVQEVIVQNFRAKAGTRMAAAPEPALEELLWTIAVARLILPGEVAVQAPPNLTQDFARLLDAGIDDWGGVSPLTIDHVNPEAPWPEIARLREATRSPWLELAPRLTGYPRCLDSEWLDPR